MAVVRFYGCRTFLTSRRIVSNKLSLICLRSSTTSTNEDFFERNRQLSRPLSPHLTILMKHPPLPAMLSIGHRITGVILGVDISSTTICWLASGQSFNQFIESAQALSLHPSLIMAWKFCFAFPFTYHFLNAFRHFAWDAGHGFKMKTAYASGYIVMALSLVSAIGLTLYTPSL